ncbi:VUT family protein [Acinetobacter indicus]|uniref:VUT family protein n=1 Tax=Acinetobacter indicus TaxID=756892 RepID=UPI0025779022|nr:VUT family protein [Acinetobacter indicus]MDM1328926.1 VUT family protein [Acinetobacter indicus]
MNISILVPFFYVLVIVIANLSTTYFGLWITPLNAFFLIGAELVLRDVMHESLSKMKMLSIVILAGIISFLINSESKNIAIASFLAIVISCFVDYYVYSKTKGTWIKRSNASNFFSGFTDSLVFPLVAFGVFNPYIFVLQWLAKFVGGFIWTLFLNNLMSKHLKYKQEDA